MEINLQRRNFYYSFQIIKNIFTGEAFVPRGAIGADSYIVARGGGREILILLFIDVLIIFFLALEKVKKKIYMKIYFLNLIRYNEYIIVLH